MLSSLRSHSSLGRRLGVSRMTTSQRPLCLQDLRVKKSSDGITVITLDRPKARNAFSRNMAQEFTNVVDYLRDDRESRVVIIESAVERVFCAGADLKERREMAEHEVGPFVEGLRRMFTSLEKLPMPTIAAIEGAALGGGLELAMCCDIRVAGSGAIFGLPETSLAIIPGAGGTQRLPRLVGLPRAKELIFTADRISASRAEEIGLVNHTVAAGEAAAKATEIALAISKNGPVAVRMAKAAVGAGMQCDLSTAMDIERGCYAQVIQTKDRAEGLLAFQEKRTPSYRGE